MRTGILLAMMVMAAPAAALAQDDARAGVLAKELLDKGAELFDKRDASAMAATYLQDATITLVKRESEDAIKMETRSGRAAIEATYRDLFKDRQPDHRALNTVESATFLGNDMLLIRGRFAMNAPQGDTLRFVQVRAREGKDWRIATMQLFELPK